MMICRSGFNLILAAVLVAAALLTAGCQSAEKKRLKQETVLRIHLETRPDNNTNRTQVVTISEAQLKVNIEKVPILTEHQVEAAKVEETLGGFVLSIKFERQGAWLLENASGNSFGKRFAIFAQFKTDPSSKTNIARWIAAPKISQRIQDGTLIFTADATREEADNIVLGLNNVARKVKKGIIW